MAAIVTIGFVALTVTDIAVAWDLQTGPVNQMLQNSIGHLWNARRTLNLTLSGQEWVLAGEVIAPLSGNPQCANKWPWEICRVDFDLDLMSDSFISTGNELIILNQVADSFTKAQALQNNQKYIDEAVVHVEDAVRFAVKDGMHEIIAILAWMFLLIGVVLLWVVVWEAK